MLETTKQFVDELSRSLGDGTFVKLTLGNYKGTDPHLQKILGRVTATKKGTRLFLLYRYDTRDTAKNFEPAEGVDIVQKALDGEFFSGHLFTTSKDLQLEIGRKGKSRLNESKPTFKNAPTLEHDRQKKIQIDPNSFYLKALGITTDDGKVRDKQQDKWRQINKFVEILSSLVDKSDLSSRSSLSIVDMGCGKGYLTFAAYDYFANRRNIDVQITGIDTRSELMDLCNGIAESSGFTGLRFVRGSIADTNVSEVDVLIALHACNTATDDAIYKGIKANAGLIVVSPCCHQELRPQMRSPEPFEDVLKHGIMMERMAEMVTDGMRSMLLERSGYATRIFEFVPVEHTAKNTMLVGTRLAAAPNLEKIDAEIHRIKDLFGIERQHLETLLNAAGESEYKTCEA